MSKGKVESPDKTFIAVVGCAHGLLDKIYEAVKTTEEVRNIKISLLICCGDFQGVRNLTDLRCMKLSREERESTNRNGVAVPRSLYDFHRYYSGEKTAHVTTIFIGGNHEASNYLQELPYGGWVAPNIYYLGYAGVVKFGSLRIAGISGIFKEFDYAKGRYEYAPYRGKSDMTSVYHYRALEIFRLMQISMPVDIMLSHDWPKNIHNYGDHRKLYRENPVFRDDMNKNHLGSGPLIELLKHLKPKFWLAGHMHAKFSAIVNHEGKGSKENSQTNFFAVDKARSDSEFLQIIDVPKIDDDLKISFDAEWLAILKSTNFMYSSDKVRNPHITPDDKPIYTIKGDNLLETGRKTFTPTKAEIDEIYKLMDKNLDIEQLQTFATTAPPYSKAEESLQNMPALFIHTNPQTTAILEKFELTDPMMPTPKRDNTFSRTMITPTSVEPKIWANIPIPRSEDEIDSPRNNKLNIIMI